jgi:hypothetical protein
MAGIPEYPAVALQLADAAPGEKAYRLGGAMT